ncbi:MAG: OmpH family outer membrane protein [Chitinophagales bacterium]|nr:OmpH family outer membrane protein [Chitinophagales bacterium]
MNKWLLVLNGVLVLAVGFLFYKQMQPGGKKGKTTTGELKPVASEGQPVRIGYFEMDSVETNFELFKEVEKEMNRKADAMTGELTRLQQNLQKEYDAFQAQAPGMTQEQGEAAQRKLQLLDNQIRNTRDRLDQERSQYFMEKQQKILNMIRDYFKQYNEDKGYTYIFASEPGLMYLKDTAFNLTSDLLKGLNEMHAKEKAKTKKE